MLMRAMIVIASVAVTIIMIMIMIVIAFAIMMLVAVRVPGPRGKGIRQPLPRHFALRHFIVSQEATVELTPQRFSRNIQRHDRKRLAAVSKRFPPLLASSLWHFGFASLPIARCPPMTGRRALQLCSG